MGVYGTRDGKFTAKKLIVQDKVPVTYGIGKLIAVSTTYFVDGFNMKDATAAATVSNLRLAAQPPYPAKIFVYTATAGATSAAATDNDYLRVEGYDAKGQYIAENIYAASAVDTRTYSNNAYARITMITAGATTSTTSDGLNIGLSSTIGLPYPIASSADIINHTHGYNYSTTVAGAGKVTVDTTYDTLELPTLTAGSTLNISYISKFQK
jgi:hypothetical protein